MFKFTSIRLNTYLFLLLIEVIDDDTNEEVEGKEGAEDNEDDEVQVHVKVRFVVRLQLHLQEQENVVFYYTFTLLMCITSNLICISTLTTVVYVSYSNKTKGYVRISMQKYSLSH